MTQVKGIVSSNFDEDFRLSSKAMESETNK